MIKTILSFSLLLLTGCIENKKIISTETAIINDIFLDVVGTLGYDHTSLRPSPDEPQLFSNESIVWIAPTYRAITKDDINAYIRVIEDSKKTLFNPYLQLLKKQSIVPGTSKMDTTQLVRTGKYKIQYKSRFLPDDKIQPPVKGKVDFSRMIIDQAAGIALLDVTIYCGPKNGIKKLVLLHHSQDTWQIKLEDLLEIW